MLHLYVWIFAGLDFGVRLDLSVSDKVKQLASDMYYFARVYVRF
jgi:hypothetical protein